MTAPITSRPPVQTPPPPFTQARIIKPAKDTLSMQHMRYAAEKKLIWKSLLRLLFAKIPALTKLWLISVQNKPLSAQHLHQIKIPKFLPESAQIACANALASQIKQTLTQQHFSCIEALSILPLPDLSASPAAEKQISTLLGQKIEETGQVEKYALGWAIDYKAPYTQDQPKISKLFIDAFIDLQPPHIDLTLESIPATKGDLTRLANSLKNTQTLRLSTTIESEITDEFIEALKAMPKLNTLVFKHPENLPMGRLKNKTWDRLNAFLNTSPLNVKLDCVFPPKPAPEWMKKITGVLEPKQPDLRVEVEQKI